MLLPTVSMRWGGMVSELPKEANVVHNAAAPTRGLDIARHFHRFGADISPNGWPPKALEMQTDAIVIIRERLTPPLNGARAHPGISPIAKRK